MGTCPEKMGLVKMTLSRIFSRQVMHLIPQRRGLGQEVFDQSRQLCGPVVVQHVASVLDPRHPGLRHLFQALVVFVQCVLAFSPQAHGIVGRFNCQHRRRDLAVNGQRFLDAV